MSNTIGIIALCLGMAFNILGCIGLVRLPDLYTRMQATTKCVTMGTSMLCIGVAILSWHDHADVSLKAILCMVAVLLTAPTAAHALARSAHKAGIPLWEKTVSNAYDADRKPEPGKGETK